MYMYYAVQACSGVHPTSHTSCLDQRQLQLEQEMSVLSPLLSASVCLEREREKRRKMVNESLNQSIYMYIEHAYMYMYMYMCVE